MKNKNATLEGRRTLLIIGLLEKTKINNKKFQTTNIIYDQN